MGATAVGGMTMGADPIACAALAGGADVKAFFVRKEAKAHALGRRIEGPALEPDERCMIVEDVVTTGGSTIAAIEAVRAEGHGICGVLAMCDRLAGGAEAIEQAAQAPFVALTTIDEIYPERPDRSNEAASEAAPSSVASAGSSASTCQPPDWTGVKQDRSVSPADRLAVLEANRRDVPVKRPREHGLVLQMGQRLAACP